MMKHLKIILILLLVISSVSLAQWGRSGRYGRGGLSLAGGTLTGDLYLVQDGDSIVISPGLLNDAIRVAINSSNMFTIDTTGVLEIASNFRMANDTYFQARNNADDAWLDLLKVNTSDEFVSGIDLVMGKLAVSPGANVILADMDTTGEAAGELSYQFRIGDVSWLELYGAYDANAGFDSSRIDISAVLSLADDLRLAGSSFIGDGITDVMTLNGTITSDQSHTSAATPFYFRTSNTVTSGDHNNLRARAQATAVGASTADLRGVYGQGITNASKYGGSITGVFANAIAKNLSTTVNVRGLFAEAESEATPTSITNLYAGYFRTKVHRDPATDYYGVMIDNEKMAGGFVADAFLGFKSTTWGAAETSADYGLDMNAVTKIGTADIRFHNGALINNSTAALLTITEATVDIDGALTAGSVVSGAGVSGTDITSSSHFIQSVEAGITATNPGVQGDSPLTKDINEVSTVGAGGDAVTLPTAVAGYEIFIINNGANILEIFPASGDNLGAGVDAATTLAAGANVTFVSYDTTNWEIK